jgi:hypothetical protein
MKIEPQVLKYLKGEAFQSSLNVEISKEKHRMITRESAITEIIRNTDVVHIGCSDHIQIINDKIKNNIWLHKLISENSKRCIGIDIDRESIEFIKKELGYQNVFYGNILTDEFKNITESKWDYAVFGEIVEHLDDPVHFLKVFKTKYGENVSRFIITVPTVYNKRQLTNMLNYREVINSDHRFWFTPYTISKVLVSAGYNPDKIIYSNLQSLNIRDLIKRKIRKILGMRIEYPYFYFSTMIITGNIN